MGIAKVSTKSPIDFELKSPATKTDRAVRWVNRVYVHKLQLKDGKTYLTIKLHKNNSKCLSIQGQSAYQQSKAKPYRVADFKYFTFMTQYKLEVKDLDGNDTMFEEVDLVSIRFTPMRNEKGVLLALKAVIVM